MPLLNFISDDNFIAEVENVITVARSAQQEAQHHFSRNVIDPFAALFEIASFNLTHNQWKETEAVRQAQKSLQNSIGNFHQKILGHVAEWRNLGVGSEVDLENSQLRIVAEIKNKYNTVSGGQLRDIYYELENLVMPKASKFKGYTAYFVNIIPKNPARFNLPFTPSDRAKGHRCTENPLIRIIDGASFYHLVTGREHALQELFLALPQALQHLNQHKRIDLQKTDTQALTSYFSDAFGH
jgi:hypothetical protein